MVVIRLTRMGAKKKPYYRIVAVDREKPRETAVIEFLGHYDPKTNPAKIDIDMKKYEEWLKKGAQPSETVRSLIKKLTSVN
jgi:small subunit ribosomal protein S16